MTKELNGAILSDCELYRYALWRTICDGGDTIAFIGVNPSTANHTIDDATVRKWRGFCYKKYWAKFIVGNLFAYRATDVNDLKKVTDPVGFQNDYWLEKIIAKSDILIPCWGNKSKTPKDLRFRIDAVENMLKQSGKPVLCFGKTTSGCPKHPLMLSYDTEIVNYFEDKPHDRLEN